MSPQASIVVPAYNAAPFLAETIESVRAQELAAWELVVVDDGSRDETASIAERFAQRDPRIRVVKQPNRGVSTARNQGLAATSPDSACVLFLDADDRLRSDALGVLSSALDAQPNALGAHGLGHSIRASGESAGNDWLERWGRERRAVARDGTRALDLGAPTDLATLAYKNIVISTHVLLRKSRLPAGELFDPSRAYSEDYHLWLRLACRGSFAFVNRVTLDYREHANNASRRRRKLDLGEVAARRGVAADPATTPEQRAILCRGYAVFERDSSRSRMQTAYRDLSRGRMSEGLANAYRATRSFVASRRALCAACAATEH